MKEEGPESDALPLSLSKKDAGNNANNQTTSPTLVPSTLASASPFLTAPLSAATRAQVVEATLAAISAEVAAAAAAAAAAAHATAGAEVPMADNNGGGKLPRGPKDSTGAASRDKIFVCSVCHRCFGYKHVLQNHERTHTGEKPFECKECHKRFTRDHHLKTHMRLHTGEKPYHCTHCERQFVQVANLRRHLRVHTGERPYACELCTSRFSDSNQLKAHMLIHKGEKPFECKQCLGRFRRRHHLMHHKCPKDESNMGKPRRGRRPKTSEDLEREARQLPTVVPHERPPKRERKPRETRRIIKVSMPPIMALGEGSRYAMASPFAARPPPPISPPEQTEPEDLSMHSNDNGDRQPRMPSGQQPPRPSSVPLSVGAGIHPPLPLLSSRAKTPPGRDRDKDGRTCVLVVDDGDGGSESEAMVEEEEEDEDEDDDDQDEDEHCGSCIGRRRIRMQQRGRRGDECDEDDLEEEMDEEDEMLSEGMGECDEESVEDEDLVADKRRMRGRIVEFGAEAENNGGTVSPHSPHHMVMTKSLQQQLHHPHYHPHHLHPLHQPHHHHPHHHPLQGGLVAHSIAQSLRAESSATTGRSANIALLQQPPHNNKKLKDDENGDGHS